MALNFLSFDAAVSGRKKVMSCPTWLCISRRMETE